jgi:hypothetical protein
MTKEVFQLLTQSKPKQSTKKHKLKLNYLILQDKMIVTKTIIFGLKEVLNLDFEVLNKKTKQKMYSDVNFVE